MCLNFANAQTDEEVKAAAASGIKTITRNDTGWSKGGFFATNFSNTTFSNWSAGGTNNSAIVANTSLFAIFNPASKAYIWENYLDLAYGVIRNGSAKTNGIANPFVKNEDKLIFTTKYGRKITKKLNYAALFNLNTQMFQGWAPTDILRKNNHISNILAQGNGVLSVGFDYKPKSFLSIYFSPLTAKYTVVREQRLANLGLYGVRAAEFDYTDTAGGKQAKLKRLGETLRKELGWYANIFFKKDIAKNINLQSRLELFNSYASASLGKLIDVNWQNAINMKVNKYISVSIINQLIYDHDIDVDNLKENGIQRAIQFKNFFGVGFSAKFGDKL
jgi:hypothetical protein